MLNHERAVFPPSVRCIVRPSGVMRRSAVGMDLHSQTNGKAAPPPDLADDCDVILSPREKKLLRRFALGKSDKVIACEIGGTQQRIGMQRKRLIEKLQIQSQAQLVALAAQLAAWPARRRASGIYLRKGRR